MTCVGQATSTRCVFARDAGIVVLLRKLLCCKPRRTLPRQATVYASDRCVKLDLASKAVDLHRFPPAPAAQRQPRRALPGTK